MEEISISQIQEETIQHNLPPSTYPMMTETKKRMEDKKEIKMLPKIVRRGNEVSEDLMRIIRNMKRNAYKPKEISILTDLTKATVKKIISQMKDEKPLLGEVSLSQKKRGRKKTENTGLQDKINGILEDNDSITLKLMKDRLKDGGYDISVSYLSKTMKKMGIKRKTNRNHYQT